MKIKESGVDYNFRNILDICDLIYSDTYYILNQLNKLINQSIESKQKQKSEMKRDNKYVKSFINDRFNQYLDEKEEQDQRDPVERVIDGFKLEIEIYNLCF